MKILSEQFPIQPLERTKDVLIPNPPPTIMKITVNVGNHNHGSKLFLDGISIPHHFTVVSGGRRGRSQPKRSIQRQLTLR
jgi:hypothetical protein